MTEAGRAREREISSRGNRSDTEITELALLQLCEIEGKPLRADRAAKLPGGRGGGAAVVAARDADCAGSGGSAEGADAEDCGLG